MNYSLMRPSQKIVCIITLLILNTIAYGGTTQSKTSSDTQTIEIKTWEHVKPFAGQLVIYKARKAYFTRGAQGYPIGKKIDPHVHDSSLRVGLIAYIPTHDKNGNPGYAMCRLINNSAPSDPCTWTTPHIERDNNKGDTITMRPMRVTELALVLNALEKKRAIFECHSLIHNRLEQLLVPVRNWLLTQKKAVTIRSLSDVSQFAGKIVMGKTTDPYISAGNRKFPIPHHKDDLLFIAYIEPQLTQCLTGDIQEKGYKMRRLLKAGEPVIPCILTPSRIDDEAKIIMRKLHPAEVYQFRRLLASGKAHIEGQSLFKNDELRKSRSYYDDIF